MVVHVQCIAFTILFKTSVMLGSTKLMNYSYWQYIIGKKGHQDGKKGVVLEQYPLLGEKSAWFFLC